MGRVRINGRPSLHHVFSHAKHGLVDIPIGNAAKAKEDKTTAQSPPLHLLPRETHRESIVSLRALPTEIWFYILDMVNQDLFYPYKSITPDTFASFMLSTRWTGAPPIGFDDWNSCRLVCRQFYAIVGGAHYAHVTHKKKAPIPKNVKALSVGARNQGRTVDLFGRYIFVGEVQYSALATLDVTITADLDLSKLPPRRSGVEYCFERLFLHAKALPNLKALYLESYRRRDIWMNDFWFQLQGAFPNLVPLSLCNIVLVQMQYDATLLHLETLALESFPRTWTDTALNFPALKHVSVASYWNLESSFWVTHSPQLESLLITTYGTFDNRILDTTHSLRMLGVPRGALRELTWAKIPPNLDHLSVSAMRIGDAPLKKQDGKELAERLEEISNIKKLTIYLNQPLSQTEGEIIKESLVDSRIETVSMPVIV